MAEITKIERLDGKNYQSWKYNIKVVLMERGLWRFVEGTETATSASAAAKDRFLIETGTSYLSQRPLGSWLGTPRSAIGHFFPLSQ